MVVEPSCRGGVARAGGGGVRAPIRGGIHVLKWKHTQTKQQHNTGERNNSVVFGHVPSGHSLGSDDMVAGTRNGETTTIWWLNEQRRSEEHTSELQSR